MKIDIVKQNYTNFHGIHAVNNAEKKCGIDSWLLAFSSFGIDGCNNGKKDEYEILIKPIKNKRLGNRNVGCFLLPMFALVTGFLGGMFAGIDYIAPKLLEITNHNWQVLTGWITAIPSAIALESAVLFKRFNDFTVQAGTKIEKDENGEYKLGGLVTKEYTLAGQSGTISPSINFDKQISELRKARFDDFIKNYDTDDLFEPKNYLRLLNNRPEELEIPEFFKYPIDNKGNNLTTAFFDVVPSVRGREDYQKILEYLQKQEDIDYIQKDGAGISIIEKVLISENKDALNLIINAKKSDDNNHKNTIKDNQKNNSFSILYSPEYDDVYANIQDKEFKKMVDDNVKWDFSDWISVILSHDVSKAELLKKRFNSPLLNKKQMFDDINKTLSNCSDLNFITYMQTDFLKELKKDN